MDLEFIGLRSDIVYKEVVYSAEEVAEELGIEIPADLIK